MQSRFIIRSVAAASLLATTLAMADVNGLENYPMPYMEGTTLMTAPNGAVTAKDALEAAAKNVYRTLTVEEITDGLWVIGGNSIVISSVIEAPEGLIVYDTGIDRNDGERLRAIIEEQISKEPIRAIIYSHSHYVQGAGALVDDPSSVVVIGHPTLNATIEANRGASISAEIPELAPVLTARAAIQFNAFLPTEGEDASLGARIPKKGELAFLPVTRPVEDGETVNVAGIDLQFFTAHVSDDHSTTVWIPEKKAVLNNYFWPGTPNLYSLRGAVYRDPQLWRDGLRVIRDLHPDYLLNTHARAISGKEKVEEMLTRYMDLVTLTYDQTLRGILRGLGPEELRYFVYQPKVLRDAYYNAQSYGESPWFPAAIYQYQLGWFDGDATELAKLPPKETSARLVELMGGPAKVIAAAQEALDKKEYAWAAQLVDNVYRIDPENADARTVKADALRAMGQVSPSLIGRAFFLSEARELEGKVTLPVAVPTAPQMIVADPAGFVNQFRVRIDPRKGEDVNKVITFQFGDQTAGLHVRNGIAEFLPDPAKYSRKADITLDMDAETWAELYLKPAELKSLVEADRVKVSAGSLEDADAVFALFDPLGQ